MVAQKARWCHGVAWQDGVLVARMSENRTDSSDLWVNVDVFRLKRTDIRRVVSHLGFSGAASRLDAEMLADIQTHALRFKPVGNEFVSVPTRWGTSTPTPSVSASPTITPEPTPSVSEPVVEPTTNVVGGSVESALESLVRTVAKDEIDRANLKVDHGVIADLVVAKVNELVSRPVVNNIVINGRPAPASSPNRRIHKQYKMIFDHLMAEDDVYVYGGPGCGKTETVSQIFNDWGRDFLLMPFSNQSTKSELVGFENANGVVRETPLVEMIQRPSGILFDEFDSCPPPIALVLNAMVANRVMSTAKGMYKVHPECTFVFSGNTTLDGATSQMTGRTTSDMATKDRLSFLEFELDEDLETGITKDILGDDRLADTWLQIVRTCRANVNAMGTSGSRYSVTPRASYKGAKLLANGFDLAHVAKVRIRKGADDRVWSQITQGVEALVN